MPMRAPIMLLFIRGTPSSIQRITKVAPSARCSLCYASETIEYIWYASLLQGALMYLEESTQGCILRNELKAYCKQI